MKNIVWTLDKQISYICCYVQKMSAEFVSKMIDPNGGVLLKYNTFVHITGSSISSYETIRVGKYNYK
jgi:hypothetical protein